MNAQEECIGREVSVAIPHSRRRRRGYVAEATDAGQLLLTFYPERGDELIDDATPYDISRVRLLKAGVPTGWCAVDVRKPNDSPYLSLRLRPWVIDSIERYASERGVSLEEGFNMILREQLDRLEAAL